MKTSQINIEGLVSTIRDTNVYVAMVEAINNSIYSIEQSGRSDGKITVELIRDASKLDLKIEGETDDKSMPGVTTIKITDNGAGFTDINLDSFNEAYTRNKVAVGGKGFGRFVYLKHFTRVTYDSVYHDGGYKRRTFELGHQNQIVSHLTETVAESTEDTVTELLLWKIKDGALDKKSSTIARKLLERILIHFVRTDFRCPQITIIDDYEGIEYDLNSMLNDTKCSEIELVKESPVVLAVNKTTEQFNLKVFKIWFPGNTKSKIVLTSHYLEVTDALLEDHINEFESGFIGEFTNKSGEKSNHFVLRAYVTGEYLDKNVNRERVSFNFGDKGDGIYPFGSDDIEAGAAEVIKEEFLGQFNSQRDVKKEAVARITTDSPWLKNIESTFDLSSIRASDSEDDITVAMEVVRIRRDRELSLSAEALAKSDTRKLTDEQTEELIKGITLSNKNDLARYVARRKAVLDIFKKSLSYNRDGNHEHEKVVHDIIFPMRTTSDIVDANYQNLWMIDERLNFTEFISSDNAMSKKNKDRADLFIFHNQVAFRAGDERQNPITIVEFKRPGRDDFVGKSNKENPITQIVRYVREIRDKKYKSPEGRPIHTDEGTMFYGYIVVDFTKKVTDWLEFDEDYLPMPDALGFYKWHTSINL